MTVKGADIEYGTTTAKYMGWGALLHNLRRIMRQEATKGFENQAEGLKAPEIDAEESS